MFPLLSLLISVSSLLLSPCVASDHANANNANANVITSLSQLSYDQNHRLKENYLLYEDSQSCRNKLFPTWDHQPQRTVQAMSTEVANQFRRSETCVAVCLEKGAMKDYVSDVLAKQIFNGNSDEFVSTCQRAEVGFISYRKTVSDVYWVNDQGRRVKIDSIKYGEKQMRWTNSFLGHQFVIFDSESGELVDSLTVTHHRFVVIGDAGSGLKSNPPLSLINTTFQNEWRRADRVKRTFTPLGFSKGKLPRDLWNSISTYYYNNQFNAVREEWEMKGVFVNWWEVTPYMIHTPFGLKKYWQARLKDLVQEWIGGVEIELTDIYGIRRYDDGARLLTHVDREATHATSLIINVDQQNMREDWMVEIYDFSGRLHEIPMEPGDIVYYESARCLHGRMKPLRGSHYANIFAHYRPVGDPEWFLKPNPPGTPKQLLDIGECTKGHPPVCTKASLPYLSPELEVVQSGNDLMTYWEKVGRPEIKGKDTIHSEL